MSGKFCLIVSSQDPSPTPHILQVIQVKDVRMFPTMYKWQKRRERKIKLLSSFDSDKMSLSQESTLNNKAGEKEVYY